MAKKADKKISENLLPALGFGFKYINAPEVTSEDIKLAKQNARNSKFLHNSMQPFEEIIALLRDYKEHSSDAGSQLSVAYEGSMSGAHNKHRKTPKEDTINLHIIGSESSATDALLMKAAESILRKSGYKNLCLKINDIGGKTSQSQFNREATNYYRKHIADLHPNARQLFKEGVYELLTQGRDYNSDIHTGAPKTMDFLGEDTRKHFGEVLEFLEYLDIPYEIDNFVMGDQNYSSHTVFEIHDLDSGKILASGGRYNLVAKKVGLRKDIFAAGAMIRVGSTTKKISTQAMNKIQENKFFLIQVGYEAKIKALGVINKMLDSGIVLNHSIYRDKLSAQLVVAKKINAEFLLIIGYKEALDGTVIVKDAQGRSQKAIKIDELAEYLKKF